MRALSAVVGNLIGVYPGHEHKPAERENARALRAGALSRTLDSREADCARCATLTEREPLNEDGSSLGSDGRAREEPEMEQQGSEPAVYGFQLAHACCTLDCARVDRLFFCNTALSVVIYCALSVSRSFVRQRERLRSVEGSTVATGAGIKERFQADLIGLERLGTRARVYSIDCAGLVVGKGELGANRGRRVRAPSVLVRFSRLPVPGPCAVCQPDSASLGALGHLARASPLTTPPHATVSRRRVLSVPSISAPFALPSALPRLHCPDVLAARPSLASTADDALRTPASGGS
ncbi:hypothetical protein HPB51_024265 [Rhipicephalus microplus]|uniref:Uncharacterized protein n=1 Tax=Rhipicephalus microplus TaxID=6941 RepID=A0A9J6EJ89_RHIMP|nr:hypothetical protein HPB51_024265 [Rhipicephalus microplus]